MQLVFPTSAEPLAWQEFSARKLFFCSERGVSMLVLNAVLCVVFVRNINGERFGVLEQRLSVGKVVPV